jgi:WD40 repeat protein
LVILANHDGQRLEGKSFRDVRLEHVHFNRAHLTRCDFEVATVLRSAWEGAVVEDTSFRGTRLWDNVLDGARFVRCSFDNAEICRKNRVLDLATARGTRFESCSFRGANLEGQRVSGATFVDCTFDGLLVPPVVGPDTVAPLEVLERWKPEPPLRSRTLERWGPGTRPARAVEVTPGRGDDKVSAVAYRPDGSLLATGSERGTRIWEVATGRAVMTLPVAARALSWDRAGSLLALSGSDGVASLWHVAERRCLGRWSCDDRHLEAVALSPDGALLAFGGSSRGVRLVRTQDAKEVATIERRGTVAAIAFHPNGGLFATASWGDDTVLLSDELGRCVRELAFARSPDGVTALAFCPMGDVLVAAGKAAVARWALSDGRLLGAQDAPSGRTYALAFDPTGFRLYFGGTDQGPSLRVATSGGRAEAMGRNSDTVYALSAHPDGEHVAIGSRGHAPQVLTHTTRERHELGSDLDRPLGAAISPCGQRIVVGYGRSDLGRPRTEVFSVQDGARVESTPVGLGSLHTVGFTSRGTPFTVTSSAVMCRGTEVCGLLQAKVRPNPGGGDSLAVLGEDGMTIVNVETGDQVGIEVGDPMAAALTLDGTIVAASRADGKVRLWDARTGRVLGPLDAHLAITYALAFSPDGRVLATGDEEGHVTLWDVDSGQVTTRLAVQRPVAQVLFSPDGRLLLARAADEPVRVWDVRSDAFVAWLGEPGCVVDGVHPASHVALGHDTSDRVVVWGLADGSERGFLVCSADRVLVVDQRDGGWTGDGVELAHGVEGLRTVPFPARGGARRDDVLAGLFREG